MFDEWKNNHDQSIKDKNQPKIINTFSPDREKCKYFLVLKDVLITSKTITIEACPRNCIPGWAKSTYSTNRNQYDHRVERRR
jgi:hypothetical protein